MRIETLIVGAAADFQPSRPGTPTWEHQILIADHNARPLALDTLRAPPHRRFLSIKGFDIEQLARIARRARRAPRLLAQSEQSGYLVALALFLFRVKTPLFIIFHGQHWWTRRNRWLAAIARRQRHVQFLCLASSLATILVDELGIDRSRVHVTGFGADADFFRPAPAPETGLIVAAGTASRDYRTLVAAVVGSTARVEIAADSTWYKEALNTEGLTMPSNVSLFSAGDYEGLRALYARAQLVVVPLVQSRYAAGYAVIAEAMAMGKPVLVTKTDAPSDMVIDGVTGLYISPGDPVALRATIDRLLDQPAVAQAMGDAARAAVERSSNVRAYAGRIIAVMDAQTSPA